LTASFPILYGQANTVNPWNPNLNKPFLPIEGFSFECGDGWFDIIKNLSEKIEDYNRQLPEDAEPIRAVQVKEKYGTLRFYTNYGTEEIFDLIELAEKQSEFVCEKCGATGILREENGWFYTSCQDCVRNVPASGPLSFLKNFK
jgi:predicted RNA-binding Zn-ribbon protein involved in translation (DUF1610 family)